MQTKEEQEKGCPRASERVSQETGESLRRGAPEKGEKASEGGPKKGRKASQRDGPGRGGSLRKGLRPRALGQRDFTLPMHKKISPEYSYVIFFQLLHINILPYILLCMKSIFLTVCSGGLCISVHQAVSFSQREAAAPHEGFVAAPSLQGSAKVLGLLNLHKVHETGWEEHVRAHLSIHLNPPFKL